MYEGHAVNGTWLNTLGCETDIHITAPDAAGDDLDIPYSSETLSAPVTPRGNDYTLDLVIAGQYPGEVLTANVRKIFHERVQSIGTLIINDYEPYTLSRRLVLTAGDQVVTTRVKYGDGFDIQRMAPPVGRAVVRLKKLWPYFYGTATAGAVPGTITAAGSAATNRMVITMSGGTGQVLTNTTTGEVITITSGSGTMLIDPLSRTATRGGVNNIGSVSFAGPSRTWMRLKPGSNVFTVSSGTASISYYPAWL